MSSYLSIDNNFRAVTRDRNRDDWMAVKLHVLKSLFNQSVYGSVLKLVISLIISLLWENQATHFPVDQSPQSIMSAIRNNAYLIKTVPIIYLSMMFHLESPGAFLTTNSVSKSAIKKRYTNKHQNSFIFNLIPSVSQSFPSQ